jgi:hypothetical protein
MGKPPVMVIGKAVVVPLKEPEISSISFNPVRPPPPPPPPVELIVIAPLPEVGEIVMLDPAII